MLTPITEQANESSLQDSAREKSSKLFFDEAWDPSVWVVWNLEALDQLIEVGLDQLVEQPIARLARLVVADGFRALDRP